MPTAFMPKPFQKIGITSTQPKAMIEETILAVIAIIEAMHQPDIKLSISDDIAPLDLPAFCCKRPKTEIVQDLDLMIAIGGDGSLLHTARAVVEAEVPVLGINRGRLGFLADLDPHELEALPALLKGAYREEQRYLLQTKVFQNKTLVHQATALNDIVLYSGDIARMIEFDLVIDHTFVYRQRSDGLIVSTPTGSTAYALSAGGPIIHPQLAAILLVPICAHQLSARPLVIDNHSTIRLQTAPHSTHPPRLSCDGQVHYEVGAEDVVIIEKCIKTLRLIHPKTQDYYAVLRNKLGWAQEYS